MDLSQLPALGMLRAACAVPALVVGDVAANTAACIEAVATATRRGAQLVLLPELCLTGYTCADLFYQETLLEAAWRGLGELAAGTAEGGCLVVAGLPVPFQGRLYNCAAVLQGGRILGLVPKTYLPTTGEFYERRWFASARVLPAQARLDDGTPFGADLLFAAEGAPGCVVGVEICEDLWAVQPPSGALALAGAAIILNPSASDELLGKASYRRDLVRQQSGRCLAAYLYASAGPGESSTDVVYSGHAMLAENGSLLAESERFRFDTQVVCADLDLLRLRHERLRSSSFAEATDAGTWRRIPFRLAERRGEADLLRPLPARPFVPDDPVRRGANCREIFAIQSAGLEKRLLHTCCRSLAVGISGGLDSTLALLVAVHAFDRLGLPRVGIHCPTMPGFGTTERTRGNAHRLVELLGCTLHEIGITDAVRQHFRDIGHDEAVHDTTFENAQARERTQILMDLANRHGGFVLGTGDLSEMALGWCTFNGDHMSMYHVNAGVPKTLVRYLVEWCADEPFHGAATVLRDICATPISPELLPAGPQGDQPQETERTVGPYELHDFFLYQALRCGAGPARILALAELAFAGRFDRPAVLRWLEVFVRRFFAQQFKRSACPDGPKVGTVALSPRGDWRMPSDASPAVWLEELARLKAGA